MHPDDELTPDPRDFVLAKKNEIYAIYLPDGGTAWLDLTSASVTFEVKWYDPRFGGELQDGTIRSIEGGGMRALGEAPGERSKDWAVLVRRVSPPVAPLSAGPAFTDETTMLVKLRTPVGASRSRPGDRVEASIISPETYLGGFLEGSVGESSADGRSRVALHFSSLRYRGARFTVCAVVTRFVNSKGHELVDDDERPATVENGTIVSEGPDLRLDEGAELTLLATPGP
jgi:hypothetical protein